MEYAALRSRIGAAFEKKALSFGPQKFTAPYEFQRCQNKSLAKKIERDCERH